MFVLGIVPENIQKFEIIIQLRKKKKKNEIGTLDWTAQESSQEQGQILAV